MKNLLLKILLLGPLFFCMPTGSAVAMWDYELEDGTTVNRTPRTIVIQSGGLSLTVPKYSFGKGSRLGGVLQRRMESFL